MSPSLDAPEVDGGLWALVTAWVQPSEWDELRRIIGEHAITRSDELRAEIAALEEILEQFQADNEARLEQSRQQQRSRVQRRLPAAPQRELLERRIRLLLVQLDTARAGRHALGAPAVTIVSTPADRAVVDYVRATSRSDAAGDDAPGAPGGGSRSGSRPGSARPGTARPSSARSSNSGGTPRPEDRLEQLADRLNAFDIDSVVEDVRAAFADEHAALLAEVDELTAALEEEDSSLVASVASAAPSDVPSDSELRRFSSKLEDAWLTQEHQLETGAKLARAGGAGPLPTPPEHAAAARAPEDETANSPSRPQRPMLPRTGTLGSAPRPHGKLAKGGGTALLQPLTVPPTPACTLPTFAPSRAVLPPRLPRPGVKCALDAPADGVADGSRARRSDKLQLAMRRARDIEQQARDEIHLTEVEGAEDLDNLDASGLSRLKRSDLASLALDSPAAFALATPRPASQGASRSRFEDVDVADEAVKATLRAEMQVLSAQITDKTMPVASMSANEDDERFLS